MMRLVTSLLVLMILVAGCGHKSPQQTAQERLRMAGMGLEEENGCTKCHDENASVLGPSWKAVAERYQGNPEARQILIDSVKNGSNGKWAETTGGVAMPPLGARIREQDLEKIVDYILSLAPAKPSSTASP
jgi:cytochrome c